MYGAAVEMGGVVPPLGGMQGKLSLTITNRGLRRTTRQVKSRPWALDLFRKKRVIRPMIRSYICKLAKSELQR